jgi:hypothetical protein
MTSVKITRDNDRVLLTKFRWLEKPLVKTVVKDWLAANDMNPKIQWYVTYMNFSFRRSEDATIFALTWS